jgi:hypothetical protein
MLSDAGFASETLMEMMLDLNGDAWVTRMQTPPPQVAAIHALFAAAPPAAIDRFRLRLGEGWGWSIPVALLRGTLDRH